MENCDNNHNDVSGDDDATSISDEVMTVQVLEQSEREETEVREQQQEHHEQHEQHEQHVETNDPSDGSANSPPPIIASINQPLTLSNRNVLSVVLLNPKRSSITKTL